eukprot:3384431-Rhodomonas_salina.1
MRRVGRLTEGEPMELPMLCPMPSSSVMSANRNSFCESVNTEAPPVCVGVHSYPGLIQYARRKRPLS